MIGIWYTEGGSEVISEARLALGENLVDNVEDLKSQYNVTDELLNERLNWAFLKIKDKKKNKRLLVTQ